MNKLIIGITILASVCLAACNSQKEEIEPAPVITPEPNIDLAWDTYFADGCDFQISHPISYVPPKQCVKENSYYIGRQIEYFVGEENIRWVVCRERGLGDGCPVMEVVEEVVIGDKDATRIRGHIGAIGGNIPQEYVTYVFKKVYDYYIFTLWALPNDAQINDASTISPLREKDLEIFERMLETLELKVSRG
ncbi:MAG: hypothetical protein V3W33_00380 [Gammaproteobacteria bacterium]